MLILIEFLSQLKRVKFKQDYPMARKFWQKYWKKIGWYKKDTKVSTKENLLDD